ncbi:MAG: formyltransferase family protein [Rhodospirillales bacterium]|nr:formyltransferase family protein [Rhodospirillales bacterium]
MLDEIILLTDEALAGAVVPLLQAVDPRVSVKSIGDIVTLERRFEEEIGKARLISFGTDIIVSQQILKSLPYPSYNIHPGPPCCPGRFPSVFAINNDIQTFGTTVHEMTEKVDEGPIVAVDYFKMPMEVDRQVLDTLSFQSAMQLISKLAPKFVSEGALPTIDEVWSGKKTSMRDFGDLCKLPADINEDEFKLRYRAIGEGPDHALSIKVFGHRFVLDNQQDEEGVTVGGQVK